MYNYQEMKTQVFEEKNQVDFLKVRDTVKSLLEYCGSFKFSEAVREVHGDSWLMMAYVDRLVELGEIREITPPNTAGQHRVFIKQ